MSKIEVNTVEPQCGTTLTLGGSGDTVALGSGASQTGFGRTGTVDWITTPKVTGDSPVTGVTGKGYFLNTTAGTITVNLPAGAAGSIVSVADYAATWQTYSVTVTPNGSEKIGGVEGSVTLNVEGQSVTLVYVDGTQGWVNTMDSTSNVRANLFPEATGGTPSTGAICGDYKTHTFTGPGSLCVSNAGQPSGSTVIDYLVVAGGGGGGRDDFGSGSTRRNGSGGGAGGFRVSNALSLPAPLTSPLASPTGITASITSYPITVGAGGPGSISCSSPAEYIPGGKGSNTIFSTITSTGGGGGLGHSCGPTSAGPAPAQVARSNGGSGGGVQHCTSNPVGCLGRGNNPPVSPSQGFPGGLMGPHPVSPYGFGGGGGGGAAAAGAVGGYLPSEGNGGSGSYISPAFGGCNGTPGPVAARYFAGGGAAGNQGGLTGGDGGGGAGGAAGDSGGAGTAGTVNTGGGGGGARLANGAGGGSGVVIIRYKFQ